MKHKKRYLTVDELLYLAQAPKSLILEILKTPSAKTHLVEIDAFTSWDQERQRDYLVAKYRLQEIITDASRYDNYEVDLSNLQLESLPPEIYFVVRRARRFRLNLSGNRFTHYYQVRRAILRDMPDHGIPFDAINLDGNPIEDLSEEMVERGKTSAHYLEEYWLRHWAKPYTIAEKVTRTMEMQRFTGQDVVNAMKLMLHMTGASQAAAVHTADDKQDDLLEAIA
ncbi:hypothetical protein [Cerasicoccus fimbriatus]|uniref:hypothetical protein n=1 Tax=Cerasicoccus fimbriatus TaxID=3014554 RepID=UPI0022B4D469|nr:hypothetical protein [Cerasicoccus sp. TK19100]